MKIFSRVFLIGILFFELLLFANYTAQSQEKNKALLIIDVQKHFTENVLEKEDAEALLFSINNLLEKKEYEHIIYIRSILRTLNVSLRGFDVDTLPNLDFDDRLKITGNNIFSKVKADVFTIPELNDYIKQHNIKSVDIAGLLGEECIYKTALGALASNLEVTLLTDAIAWKTPKDKQKICNKLSDKGVSIINMESLY